MRFLSRDPVSSSGSVCLCIPGGGREGPTEEHYVETWGFPPMLSAQICDQRVSEGLAGGIRSSPPSAELAPGPPGDRQLHLPVPLA